MIRFSIPLIPFSFLALLILTVVMGSRVLAVSEQTPNLPQVFYIHSDNPALKVLLGVDHQFEGVFSTELTGYELGMLSSMGVRVEQVQIRKIAAPKQDKCGDGVCQGFENASSCSQDCSGVPTPTPSSSPTPTPTPDPSSRSCVPDNQIPYGINMVNGGVGVGSSSPTGSGITVAVLDTGVKQDHPDLANRIVSCTTEVTHHNADSQNCEDAHGHGTHTSGTVLADGGLDGLGIYGVAPGASLMAVKVCDRRGWCFGDDVAAGIRYAADNGANIISMSIGGDSADAQELSAIDYATSRGVLVVAAAGNDGPANGSIDYPGAYVKVAAAGAINSSKNVPSWSSRGINDGDGVVEEREVEFATPGVSVESTNKNGCYEYMSGTSMSTPHVSGLAAKLWQGSASATRTYLQNHSADIWTVGDDSATGFGLPVAP